uniref:Uncharacterized protein n=1 Tax=Mimivirus LCMiAC01 TaxID=2506608 RepID=A0A481Z130_9VIRU|nr:MAG: hypothetical protein LCMiAC01_04690 [Mimivirus LCMiAC01]
MTEYDNIDMFDEYLDKLDNINRIDGLISDYDLIKRFKKYNKKKMQSGGKHAPVNRTFIGNKPPIPLNTPPPSPIKLKIDFSDFPDIGSSIPSMPLL